jgi:hypothetical protein
MPPSTKNAAQLKPEFTYQETTVDKIKQALMTDAGRDMKC